MTDHEATSKPAKLTQQGQHAKNDELMGENVQPEAEVAVANECKYIQVRKLACGSNGAEVHVFQKKSDKDQIWAGKVVNKSMYRDLKSELEILKKVGKHENTVLYFDTEDNGSTVTIYMELCDGTVEEYAKNKIISPATLPNPRPIHTRKYFDNINPPEVCLQAVKGIAFLHAENIIHRDVKPSNFLMVRTNNHTATTKVKVADFGLSRQISPSESGVLTKSTSSRFFMAQECYCTRSNGSITWRKSCDIFSLGITLFNILTNGCFPFGNDDYAQEVNIRKKMPPNLNALIESKSSGLNKEQATTARDLIKRMIHHDPQQRFTIEDVLQHPLFWDSKKKVEFYKEIKVYLQKKKHMQQQLSEYDSGLLLNGCDGKMKPFKFKQSNLDSTIVNDPGHNRQPYICASVFSLLALIRNMDAHATDPSKTDEVKELLGVERTKDGIRRNYDTFLATLTGPYPQLLVHLYEFFRAKEVAPDYYASSKDKVAPVRCGKVSSRHTNNEPCTSTAVPASVSLKPWEKYLHEQKDNLIFLYDVTLKYNGAKCTKTGTYNLKSDSLQLYHSKEETPPPSSNTEFTFPQGNSVVQEILDQFGLGLNLKTDSKSKSLFACRRTKVAIFYKSHLQTSFVKLVQQQQTEVFSCEKICEKLLSDTGQMFSKLSEVEFVIGKDPNSTPKKVYPVIVTIVSKAADFLVSNCNTTSSDSLVISV